MKKLHKKIIGICGLALVAVMTFVASQIPAPGASAVESVTDRVTVRVVGNTAAVNLIQPANNLTTTSSSVPLELSYENVETIALSVIYRDLQGENPVSTNVWSDSPNYNAGSYSSTLDLLNYIGNTGVGYGTYAFTLVGYDYEGQPTTTVTNVVTYLPVDTDTGRGTDGSIVIDVDVDKNVTKIIVDIFVGDRYIGSVEIPVINGVLVDGQYDSLPGSPEDFYVLVENGKIILPAEFVSKFGPGDFKFEITTEIDTDGDGNPDDDYKTEVIVPVTPEDMPPAPEPGPDDESDISEIGQNENGDLLLDFDFSDDANKDEIAKIKVDIYVDGDYKDSVWIDVIKDANGNPILKDGTYTTLGGETVYVENGVLRIPADLLAKWGKGKYQFVVTKYDENGRILGTTTTIYDVTNIPNTSGGSAGTPDTGSLFKSLNVSTEDFVITGLLVFFVVAGGALVVLKKHASSKASFKRR